MTPLLGVRPRQEPVPYPCEREQKQRLTEAHRLGLRRGTQATTGVVKPQVPAVWIPEGGCNRLGCVRSSGSASGLVCGGGSSPAPWASHFPGRSHFLWRHSWPRSPSLLPSIEGVLSADSDPLPSSTLLSPCFGTQPPPALVYSHHRQGCPGLFQRRLWPGWHSGPWTTGRQRKPWFTRPVSLLRWVPVAILVLDYKLQL